jgi:UDP-N-acetylglucosamine 2-epimerase (non-hydrolysing)
VRIVGAVTGGRADYGLLFPVLRAIQSSKRLELRLYVTGMHLSPQQGNTLQQIEADGLTIAERIDINLTSDAPAGIARSMSLAVGGFGEVFERAQPDILLVVGDRYEVLAAVAAAMPFTVPVAHIAGGEITEGAIDDSMRHAITKMSHLHFVTTEAYRDRVIQMGEEPSRVHLTGNPGLDHFRTTTLLTRVELEKLIGMPLEPTPVLVTFHAATLDYVHTQDHVRELLAALDRISRPIVFTAPGVDTSAHHIRDAIENYVAGRANARFVPSLGTRAYLSLMSIAAAMVGNSSSGIIEAATVELPVVDVGQRQSGRLRGKNVVHATDERTDIVAAIAHVLAPAFRQSLRGMQNLYGDGNSASRIVDLLERTELTNLVRKRFHAVAEHR